MYRKGFGSGRGLIETYPGSCRRIYIYIYSQSFWLQIQRSRVRSPALPDFLSSSGSGTGSTQPREPREVN